MDKLTLEGFTINQNLNIVGTLGSETLQLIREDTIGRSRFVQGMGFGFLACCGSHERLTGQQTQKIGISERFIIGNKRIGDINSFIEFDIAFKRLHHQL